MIIFEINHDALCISSSMRAVMPALLVKLEYTLKHVVVNIFPRTKPRGISHKFLSSLKKVMFFPPFLR